MCLTTQALMLFIGLLPPEIVTVADAQVTVAATSGEVIWDNFDDKWCTVAPLVAASTGQ